MDDILREAGIELEKGSRGYNILARELLKADIKLFEIEYKRTLGDDTLTDEEKAFLYPSRPTRDKEIEEPSETLSEVIQAYWDENKRAKAWKPRTEAEYKPNLELIMNFFGKDTRIKDIDSSNLRNFKETLLCLPRMFKTRKEYEGKSLEELSALKVPEGERISISTINDKYLGPLIAVFNYAERNGHITYNPAKGLKIKEPRKRKASEEQEVFDPGDLKKLFHSEDYKEGKHDQPFKFWLPILGLYTGCRLEELCQLYVDDIREEEGIYVLDINENHPDQSVKTSERRLVPVHPKILDLGFIEFVSDQKKKGHDRVFSELKRQGNKYGHYPSRWFSDYKKKCGIKSEPRKKTFHSFRHTLVNNLGQQLISDAVIAGVVGHARKGETGGRYMKDFEVQVLFEEAIMKLNYDIDLSHLKRS